GMAYLVRRLLENTSNEGWLRAGFGEGVSVERLLAAPTPSPGMPGEGGGEGLASNIEHRREDPHPALSSSSLSLRAEGRSTGRGEEGGSALINEPLRDFSSDE